MTDIRHFLVVKRHGKLESVRVFDDMDEAMEAYECAESASDLSVRLLGKAPDDCVLLGADRLATCIATHGNWFDEPLDLGFGMAVAETLPDA